MIYQQNHKHKRDNLQQNLNNINAAALQDHISKSLKIPKLSQINHSLKQMKSNLISNSQGHQDSGFQKKSQKNKPIVNKNFNYNNRQSEKNFVEKQLNQLKKNLIDKLSSDEKANLIKQQNYTKNLTLAQRLGLIACPQRPLLPEEWKFIENLQKLRNDNVCIICLEEFKQDNQVILNCSHVFHQRCLESFEKHSQSKTCPLCRKNQYEIKHIDQGLIQYRIRCAIEIQRFT